MSSQELTPDLKAQASMQFAEVIIATREYHPEKKYRPIPYHKSKIYPLQAFHTGRHMQSNTADGTGTKSEIAARLNALDHKPEHYEGLAYDAIAMVEGDVYRFGHSLLGITQTIDLNIATPEIVSALARGCQKGCAEGRFCLHTGETAELGQMVGGYGENRLIWNAFGHYVVNRDKLILGKGLKPGQPIVGFQEKSLRSNGFSLARDIMVAKDGPVWHLANQELTKEMLRPSTLYGPVIYDAQGGIDGKRQVKMIAAAHISGGGVPLKAKRMLEEKGLGARIEPVFPDPKAVTELMNISQNLKEPLVDERTASETWNRGLGFLVVTKNRKHADHLIEIAASHKINAATVGEVIEQPEIHWRGQVWRY